MDEDCRTVLVARDGSAWRDLTVPITKQVSKGHGQEFGEDGTWETARGGRHIKQQRVDEKQMIFDTY